MHQSLGLSSSQRKPPDTSHHPNLSEVVPQVPDSTDEVIDKTPQLPDVPCRLPTKIPLHLHSHLQISHPLSQPLLHRSNLVMVDDDPPVQLVCPLIDGSDLIKGRHTATHSVSQR